MTCIIRQGLDNKFLFQKVNESTKQRVIFQIICHQRPISDIPNQALRDSFFIFVLGNRREDWIQELEELHNHYKQNANDCSRLLVLFNEDDEGNAIFLEAQRKCKK